MKRFVLVLLIFSSFKGYSQNAINHYKYVVVPEKFNFLKQKDQYSINSLTKGLLDYRGFKSYFDKELPAELANNRCQALYADVLDSSGMFTTNLILVLKDCQGNVLFRSKEGKSREKEYKVAYDFALRDAFTSLDRVTYTDSAATTQVQAQPVGTTNAPPVTTKPAVTVPTVVAAAQSVPVATPAVPAKPTEAAGKQPAGTLYAQPIDNGYQLIDTTPKIVLTLLKTSAENYFIASNATFNGIVMKKKEDWVFEYYKDAKLISEKLLVKF